MNVNDCIRELVDDPLTAEKNCTENSIAEFLLPVGRYSIRGYAFEVDGAFGYAVLYKRPDYFYKVISSKVFVTQEQCLRELEEEMKALPEALLKDVEREKSK